MLGAVQDVIAIKNANRSRESGISVPVNFFSAATFIFFWEVLEVVYYERV